MKTLLLLRHGKSDWNASYEGDHDRPINERGRKAARRMGRFLQETGQVPGRVVTSSARRARQTLEEARKEEWPEVAVEVADALYEATVERVLGHLRGQPEEHGAVLLVGHEPTWSETVARLTGAHVRFPTAAAVRVDLAVERWADAGPDTGTLVWFVPPKLLRGRLRL